MYVQGDLYVGVWAPKSSTECRLFVSDHEKFREYDHQIFEEQMYFYNTNNRMESDKLAEYHIINNFLQRFGHADSKANVIGFSNQLSDHLGMKYKPLN